MGELFDKIRQWQPTRSTINQRWVNVPRWLEKCITEFDPPVTMKCNIWTRDDGRKVLQWEFSDETKELWAAILAEMLGELRRAVEEAHNIRKKNGQIARPPTNEEREAIANVGLWSHNLFSYLHWEEGVVQTLLTETDLADNLLSNSPAKLTRGMLVTLHASLAHRGRRGLFVERGRRKDCSDNVRSARWRVTRCRECLQRHVHHLIRSGLQKLIPYDVGPDNFRRSIL